MKKAYSFLLFVFLCVCHVLCAQDTSLSVGSPDGSFAVTPLGGASYAMPIEVPTGIGGMEPQVSIRYNSHSGNGLCGWGCDIGGISVITRGVKDIYHDNSASGISHDLDSGATGATLEGGLTLANGGSFSDAMQGAFRGGSVGLVSGGVSGLSDGLRIAYHNGLNPWTGLDNLNPANNYNSIIKSLKLEPTIDRIEKGQILIPYNHDGIIFQNREGLLPTISGTYREWIVPTPNLPTNRAGIQRIITSDREWYYTPDHYKTFIRIK